MTIDQQKVSSVKDWLGTGSVNIFGSPFSGKDTQGKQLAELFGGSLLGGGDILRNSVVPDRIKETINAGKLIPTEDYLQIVLPYLSRDEFMGKPLIFSAVGRWYGEESGVIEAADQSGHTQKAVVYLDLDERIVWRRFEAQESVLGHHRGQRHDDDAETLQIRMDEFRTKTLPVIDFYKSLGQVISIDGDQSPEAITSDIIESLWHVSKNK